MFIWCSEPEKIQADKQDPYYQDLSENTGGLIICNFSSLSCCGQERIASKSIF